MVSARIEHLAANNLLSANPKLASQWHPTLNGKLTAKDVTLHSRKKVWWLCPKGHEWRAIITRRSYGSGCPYCTGQAICDDNCLATLNPSLASQWHPTMNGQLTPKDVTLHSGKNVWWVCPKGHVWEASINRRSRGVGCPYCAGLAVCDDNCLARLNPSLARQWHPTLNGQLTPKDVTPHSKKKVWWLCEKGHSWQISIATRSYGSGCPYCTGHAVCDDNCLATLNPSLASQWHPTLNGKLTAKDVAPNSKKKIWWGCPKGHEWQASIANRSHGTGCPYCGARKRR